MLNHLQKIDRLHNFYSKNNKQPRKKWHLKIIVVWQISV